MVYRPILAISPYLKYSPKIFDVIYKFEITKRILGVVERMVCPRVSGIGCYDPG